jgi:L-ascorbate metabolism protein UlaG (beta-lactamase superfamily)
MARCKGANVVWKNPWYKPDYSHHSPDGFHNVEPEEQKAGDVRRWRRERKASGAPKPPKEGYDAFLARWWQPARLDEQGDGVWWLGHATLLLRINDRYILTDPIFSQRASPLRFLGPRRYTPPALAPGRLPPVSAVVISHNHYDHLDAASIRFIHRHFPAVHFYVPLGLGRWFRRCGITNVTELDWWQSRRDDEFAFHAVPARHWSMRTLWDRNRSLWCGWVIESVRLRFWFIGDSADSDLLRQIPRRLGPLDGAAIPTGAFEPRWFMANHHMGPVEAVALWRDIGRPPSIPVHWGAFELADEALDRPPQLVNEAMSEEEVASALFCPRRIGEFMPLTGNR